MTAVVVRISGYFVLWVMRRGFSGVRSVAGLVFQTLMLGAHVALSPFVVEVGSSYQAFSLCAALLASPSRLYCVPRNSLRSLQKVSSSCWVGLSVFILLFSGSTQFFSWH